MLVFQGQLINSISPTKLGIYPDAILGVDRFGKIVFFEETSENLNELSKRFDFGIDHVKKLNKYQFLIPGFVDTHIHAPQYVFTGTGYDLPLLDWLNKYTFPQESKFKDHIHAKNSYQKVVKKSIKCGTTTACYFATIHLDASKVLVDVISKIGQRAYVGKVNMDRNSPDFYIENTISSITETTEFVEYVKRLASPLITPVITPRFVPTCTPELMTQLGEIARKNNLPIQSHVSENLSEIEWVNSLHPESQGYVDVYRKFGLLNSKTIMAHCIYLTEDERRVFKELDVGVSHCPNSNFSLMSGILNVRQLFDEGIEKVGLGTDVAGGYSPSILDAIRNAMNASKVLYMQNGTTPLVLAELMYMATLGGAKVLGLNSKIGNFQVGKHFDALLIDVEEHVDVFEHDDLSSIFEKFIYLGDDRCIQEVYVDGTRIVAK